MSLYLCGLRECILRASGDGAKISAIDNSKNGNRGNNKQHKPSQAGRDIELEEERQCRALEQKIV